MQRLWSEQYRIGQWRRIWLALAQSQRELGLPIPQAVVDEMQAHLDDADLEVAARYEARFRHDVMAHIHAFGDQAPAARGFLHLGATSAFVTDNADVLVIQASLQLLLGRLLATLDALRSLAIKHADLPCLAYTHFQPAQLTTVGKRATLWAQDFALDVEAVLERLDTVRIGGCKGTTGTQASFLDLFHGDHDRVRALEQRIAARLGITRVYAVTGQTYPRKWDAQVVDVLSGIAQSASKFGADMRLLQHEGELLEPFGSEQVGSSAMPYKRNPMRAERMGALARHVMSLQASAAQTAASQWLERTLDDSANRRLTLPEAFLATDAVLLLAHNIAAGIEVRPTVIERHVREQLPFMTTERWLMRAVEAGGDRQALHETIRRHALATAELVSRGEPNDLLQRLSSDVAFAPIASEGRQRDLEPMGYTGRAAEQVDEFVREYLDPLLSRARALATTVPSAELTV